MSTWLDGVHIGIMTNGKFSIEEQFPDSSNILNLDIVHFYGQIIDATGNPAQGVVLRFSAACPPRYYDNTIGITLDYVDTTTNEYGIFEIDLLKTVPYKIDIRDTGLYMSFAAPSTVDIINLFELLNP